MYWFLSVTSVTELIVKYLNCNRTVTSVTDVTDRTYKAIKKQIDMKIIITE